MQGLRWSGFRTSVAFVDSEEDHVESQREKAPWRREARHAPSLDQLVDENGRRARKQKIGGVVLPVEGPGTELGETRLANLGDETAGGFIVVS